MVLLFALACVPRLYTDDADDTGGAWVAPENRWEHTGEPSEGLEGEGFQNGEVIPELRSEDQYGDVTSLWQFAGEYLLLDLSAFWCGPCQEEAPHLVELQHDFEGCAQVVTVIIQDLESQSTDAAEAAEWADSFELEDIPVFSDPEGWYLGLFPPGSTVAIPRFILVDPELRVENTQVLPANVNGAHSALEAVCD